MEKDFHYYLIYAISHICGFKDAKTIAAASQFVDDNNEGQFTIDGREEPFPEKLTVNGGYYYPIMTQSLSPRSLSTMVQKYVYVPFHFIPGDRSVTLNGKTNAYAVTPGSPLAAALLKRALDSDNPYRIGIALHSFADTWSHQNFSGFQERWNAVYPWYSFFKSIVPNVGHAEAGHSPDVISEIWTDHRFGTRIVNTDRAFKAAGEIYKIMRRKSGKGPTWTQIQSDIEVIINSNSYDERKNKIIDLLIEKSLGPVPVYDKDKWVDAALDRKGERVVMHTGFDGTDWYRFHQAAKVHFADVMQLTQHL